MAENLFEHLSLVAIENRNRDCLVSEEGFVLRYAELFGQADRIATVLLESGVQTDDRVLVQCEKNGLVVALYLACLKVGAVYVPLNTSYTDTELAYFVEDCDPKLYVGSSANGVIEERSILTLTMSLDGSGTLKDAMLSALPTSKSTNRNEGDIAAILYTSGTTGRSKGAMLTHGNLLSNAKSLIDIWGFTASDTLLHALPIYHVHGLFVAIHCVLLSGARMLFEQKFDVNRVVEKLPQSTVFMGVPTYYTRLLAQSSFNQSQTANMRLFISGSAPLSEQTFFAFHQRTGMNILERYGMSETLMNTSNPLNGSRVAGTVGYPLPQVDLRIVDPEKPEVELPKGEVGGIELKGPNVFAGYWRKPDVTEKEFRADGYFITGDMGVQDEDGRLSIVGREKDLVISGGLNVYPAEVETAIETMEEVADVAVVGAPHSDFGEGVVAVVVGVEGKEITTASVREYLKDKLAGYKRPQAVVLVDSIPHNTMGKVQKNVLREQFESVFE